MRPTPAHPTPAHTAAGAEATPAATLYRVQAGAFASRENAESRAEALRASGFSPYIVQEGGLFKVRVGAFRDRALAEQLADRLRAAGYDAAIIH